MATNENRYIEEIENEPLQPQQMGYFPDEDGGRDRTKGTFQDSFGIEHNLLTDEEIEDLISDQIAVSYNPSATSVYVKVTTPAELITALEDVAVLNIWCEGVSIAGSYSANVTSSKNIHAPSTGNLNITVFNGFYIDTPPSAATNDIIINVYAPVTSAMPCEFGIRGGYSGNPYTYKLNVIYCEPYLICEQYVNASYEIGTGSQTAFAKHELWSRLNTQLISLDETTLLPIDTTTPTNKHIVSENSAYTDVKTIEETNGATTGNPNSKRSYEMDSDEYASYEVYSENNTSFISAVHRFKAMNSLADIYGPDDCFNVDGDGHAFIGNDLPDPWDSGITVVNVGDSEGMISMFSYKDIVSTRKESGIVQGAYCYSIANGIFAGWRFNQGGDYATLTFVEDGSTIIYRSSVRGTIDNQIGWYRMLEVDNAGGIHAPLMKTGTSRVDAGAGVGELWADTAQGGYFVRLGV